MILACPVQGCSSNPEKYQNELLNLKIDGSGIIRRLANIYHSLSANYDPLQPLQSFRRKTYCFNLEFWKWDERRIYSPSSLAGSNYESANAPPRGFRSKVNPILE